MREVLVYSTHGYTASIANRLKSLNKSFCEAHTESDFLELLSKEKFNLIILDSSSEDRIFEIIKCLDQNEDNLNTSVLFMVPGKISYDRRHQAETDRSILGVSKPFDPKEFSGLVGFLIQKKKQHDELTRSFDELRQFAYRTSHDLKAPITTSRRLIEYISEDLKTGNVDEAKKNIDVIFDKLNRLEELIEDMLSLAKADLKRNKPEIIDFEAVFSEVKSNLSTLAEESGCKILMSTSASRPLKSEKNRVLQIIENLVSNAIKYSDSSKSDRYVEVSVQNKENTFRISIEDNGIGIPPEQRENVFEMFQRFHPNVSFGSGLGLSIVKKYVDTLGGTIEFNSSDEGTKFVVTLQSDC